jgi:hypothetical protein
MKYEVSGIFVIETEAEKRTGSKSKSTAYFARKGN